MSDRRNALSEPRSAHAITRPASRRSVCGSRIRGDPVHCHRPRSRRGGIDVRGSNGPIARCQPVRRCMALTASVAPARRRESREVHAVRALCSVRRSHDDHRSAIGVGRDGGDRGRRARSHESGDDPDRPQGHRRGPKPSRTPSTCSACAALGAGCSRRRGSRATAAGPAADATQWSRGFSASRAMRNPRLTSSSVASNARSSCSIETTKSYPSR